MLAFDWGAANDAVTALLVIVVGAILRGVWTLSQKVGRLEGIDEMKERLLSRDRDEEPVVRPSDDHSVDNQED